MIDLRLGNCLDVMKTLPDNSVDSIVTDPPYGLSFMNKKWDYDVPSVEIWKEALRVLKPGGWLLSFGGTRTYHRMVVNIEDAGFEIRDCIQWIYGSGFPKSYDISKGIDKAKGAERKVVGKIRQRTVDKNKSEEIVRLNNCCNNEFEPITEPATDEAKKWSGFGTALKPANEPICMARKPLEGNNVENVLKWNCGGLNIDGCRIEYQSEDDKNNAVPGSFNYNEKTTSSFVNKTTLNKLKDNWEQPSGRFPANVIFDEEVAKMVDEQSGKLKSGDIKPHKQKEKTWKFACEEVTSSFKGDECGASRFFYCAKVSKKERNMGCEELEDKNTKITNLYDFDKENGAKRNVPIQKNNHPTVKPIKLMTYLIKLVTPPNGTTLDPFMGSGSSGIAAKALCINFIGIEQDESYLEIAKKRIGESDMVEPNVKLKNGNTRMCNPADTGIYNWNTKKQENEENFWNEKRK